MTAEEITEMLLRAERSQRWLARKLGRSHATVQRWCAGVEAVPAEHESRIRELLPPVMINGG